MPSTCALTVEIVEAVWIKELRLLQLTLLITSGLGDRVRIAAGCPLESAVGFVVGEAFSVDLREAILAARENGNGVCEDEEGAGK